MMATTAKSSVQVRLDEDLKKDAERIFENLGVDAPTAIRMFFKKVVATRSIPFALEESPYTFSKEEETEILQAAEESHNPENLDGPFDTTEALLEHLRSSVS
ncbi:MAG: type II toxin-antitoxin system RelB/DinJ family antitoxin [Akkermansiaceae bacterium]